MLEEGRAGRATRESEFSGRGNCIDAATGTDAAIAFEYLLAKICRLSPQFPFVDAERGTEGEATARNFERTPATEAATIWTAGNCLAIDPTTFHHTNSAHSLVLNCAIEIRF